MEKEPLHETAMGYAMLALVIVAFVFDLLARRAA